MKLTRFLLKLFIAFSPAALCLPEVQAQAVTKKAKKSKKLTANTGDTLLGRASYYSNKFSGRRTANGETFDHKKLTAACNLLPLGTWIQVMNLKNGKLVVVKTNDRLHHKTTRLVDLTRAAAKKLGFISAGLARVRVTVLDQRLYKKVINK
ncbi:MAG: septal ring lytic transglycosylase RlpA family protein [Ferruginibacter sp.]